MIIGANVVPFGKAAKPSCSSAVFGERAYFQM